jgi:hypothetical protein
LIQSAAFMELMFLKNELRVKVLCEVAKDKFLIYSFTHDTFAVIDLCSGVVGACRLDGITEENSIEEILFSDPPTHIFYKDKMKNLNALPLRLVLNES